MAMKFYYKILDDLLKCCINLCKSFNSTFIYLNLKVRDSNESVTFKRNCIIKKKCICDPTSNRDKSIFMICDKFLSFGDFDIFYYICNLEKYCYIC